MISNFHSTDLSDNELVELSKTEPEYFGELIRRYQERLFGFIRRISYFSREDIEDIVQETFIKAYKGLNLFDDDYKFSTWIYQIARNHTIDAIRKKRARVETIRLDEVETAKLFRSNVDMGKDLERRNDLEKVKNIIQSLPYKYKEVMILRFLEDKTYEEIMDIVEKPKGTVAALINRGRNLVREEARRILNNN